MNFTRFLGTGLAVLLTLSPALASAQQPLAVDDQVLSTVFSGHERLHFSISWSGGVKIGDLILSVDRDDEEEHGFVISARVTDYGLFRLFYPVNDTFMTLVRGRMKLPVRYEVEQVEGHGSSTTRRLTRYDQERGVVRYRKNDSPEQEFAMDGPAYNEFSSFFITRALAFSAPDAIVPTFVDGKRHLVRVELLGRENKKTRFGRVQTLKIMPKMTFKGLYDKDGDTVFWLSDDQCRVPLEIDSKIVVGSLVAELVEYENPACPEWTDRVKRR